MYKKIPSIRLKPPPWSPGFEIRVALGSSFSLVSGVGMADIALLVVEEFERRKRWEKEHGMGEGMDFHLMGSFTLSAIGKKVGEELSCLKEVGAAKEVEFARKALEPRSPFGVAAFDGFFSA